MPSLLGVLDAQGGLCSRSQALQYISESELRGHLARSWQRALPGVYAAFRGSLDRSQQEQAAILYGGPTARLTDTTMLAHFGVRFLPADDAVRIVIDWSARRRSTAFVTVTRTQRLPPAVWVGSLPGMPVCRALTDFSVRCPDVRAVIAIFADALQRGLVSIRDLEAAAAFAARAGRATTHRAMESMRSGIRSAPEEDFRRIALRCHRVPAPMFNALLRLPSGRYISPDALVVDGGLVHETNGRLAHAEDDLFESMQERHDVMTAAGLTTLHNPPRRLLTSADLVGREWQQCYARVAGNGPPPGVEIIRPGPT